MNVVSPDRMRLARPIFFGLACFVFCPWVAGAQDTFGPPVTPPVLPAFKAAESIRIDGKLSETDWQQAQPVRGFFRMEPRQGGKVSYETTVRLLFDERNLYFGIFCKDSLGRRGIRVQDYRRDFEYGDNDVFYIQLDPQNLKRYCVSFQTTPLGTQRDVQIFDDAFKDIDWDAFWHVRTHVTDSGYYAEFAIPFKSLRYDRPNEGDSISWGITLARLARRDYEVSVYPPIPQAFSPYRMIYGAQITGLKLPPPSLNLRVQPYALYQFSRLKDARGRPTNSASLKAGGEIKWAMTPQSVLDVTFNTDFAQADVDRSVNNLTRFNVLFPERRQFFLENSGVFAGVDVRGLKPFFSRTIGLSNSQFNAAPVPIDVGFRFTERNQKRTWAALYVRQRGETATNFSVLRYLKNYGKQSNIGLMVTHRLDESGNDIRRNANTTVTLDGFVRPKDEFNIQYLVTASRDNSNDSIGFASNFWAEYSPSKMYAYWKSTYIDQRYVPGMGFVFATNTLYHNTGGYFIWRPEKWKFIRRWDPGIYVNYYQNANDLAFQQADLYLFPVYVIFQNGSFFEYAVTPTWQNINFDFSVLGVPIPMQRYFYTRQRVTANSDQSKKYSVSASYEFGGYYAGQLRTTLIGGRIAPVPNLALTLDYEYNELINVGGESGKANEYASLITAGLRLAYNANIQASFFYQFNSFDKQERWNVRGSWQFAPLSFVYIVFNDNGFRNSVVQNQSLICKVTFLKQF